MTKRSDLLQTSIAGALGLRHQEWLQEPGVLPVRREAHAILKRQDAIILLADRYGQHVDIKGIIAGIALSTQPELNEIREAALDALASIETALGDLTTAVLLQHPKAFVRREAFYYLCNANPTHGTIASINIACNDPDEQLRIDAVEMLIDVQTETALELARELVDEVNHRKLRDYCRHTIERDDLEMFDETSQGHSVPAEIGRQAAVIAKVLYGTETTLCLNALESFIGSAGNWGAIAMGFALLSHPAMELRFKGLKAIRDVNQGLSEWADLLISR